MKNISLSFCAMVFVMISACNKGVVYDGGTWTFKSLTYHSNNTRPVRGTIVASTGKATPSGTLNFRFSHDPDSIYPIAGTYLPVSNTAPNSSHVYISLSDTSADRYYQSTDAPFPVTVTRTNGKVTIDVIAVELLSNKDLADSATLTAIVKQTP